MINPKKLKSWSLFEDQRGTIDIKKIPHNFSLKQINITSNKKYVIRGMHYQTNKQNKILVLLSGEILDVLVDIHNYKIYYFNLTESNSTLFIPHNYAHGFQVLSSKAKLLYLFDDTFKIKRQLGFDALDKKIGIKWNKQKKILSVKDSKLQSFDQFQKKI